MPRPCRSLVYNAMAWKVLSAYEIKGIRGHYSAPGPERPLEEAEKNHPDMVPWCREPWQKTRRKEKRLSGDSPSSLNLERETRLELATPTLARLCSTN